jgi:hypothetical protein
MEQKRIIFPFLAWLRNKFSTRTKGNFIATVSLSYWPGPISQQSSADESASCRRSVIVVYIYMCIVPPQPVMAGLMIH